MLVEGDTPARGSGEASPPPLDPALLGSVYQALSARRLGYDTMMWQVPALSFTAQAFLLTIALGGGLGANRLVSAALALVIALISMQLMAKHRFNEEIDSRLLEGLERSAHIGQAFGVPPHAPPNQRMRVVNSKADPYGGMPPVRRHWYVTMSSYRLWLRGLGLFAMTSCAIITVNIIYLAGWDAPIGQFIHTLYAALP